MENLARLKNFWKNKNVLITGHSGFKGTWLTLFLQNLGANVYGCSLKPNTNPSFFLNIKKNLNIHSKYIDINDYNSLKSFINIGKPSIVFHLAAQPLVSDSYIDTKYTYKTNVLGTVNIFDILKDISSIKAIINITSDKCYLNNENRTFFKETDKLCGKDPYSNSKSCSELVSYSYYHSFFKEKKIGLATARAGNVIGGGDWSKNRIITDIVNYYFNNKKLVIRDLNSIRPWQYILDVTYGYLLLAKNLFKSPNKYSSGWNFAPSKKNQVEVKKLLEIFDKKTKINKVYYKKNQIKESKALFLDNSFTKKNLGWYAKTNVTKIINETYDWYSHFYSGNEIFKYSNKTIINYLKNYD